MGKTRQAPHRRLWLGLTLTIVVIAAALVVAAFWRAQTLGQLAGEDVGTLRSELLGVRVEAVLLPLERDVARDRLHLGVRVNPPFSDGQRRRADAGFSAIDRFLAGPGRPLGVAKQWRGIEQIWRRDRAMRPPITSHAWGSLLKGIITFAYGLEEPTGFEYDSDRYSQDLGDMLFDKLPNALDDVMYADLMSENAQNARRISISDRIDIASLTTSAYTDFDMTQDDWAAIARTIAHSPLGNGLNVPRDNADILRFQRAGTAVPNYFARVYEQTVPRGSAMRTRQFAHAQAGLAMRVNDDLITLMATTTQRRIAWGMERQRYLAAAGVFAAVAFIAAVLFLIELGSVRQREALAKAETERERLATELAREHAERALRLSEAQFRAIFDGAALGIAVLDKSGRVIDSNGVYRFIYGESSRGLLDGQQASFGELMRGERPLFEFEQHVLTPAGQEAWTDCTVSVVSDESGAPLFAMCTFRDLTELKRNERRMLHDMTHDTLTGLCNRMSFEAKVRERFAEAKQTPESSFAVLFVDLDRFKDINESLGHDAGDFVLAQIAQRLRASVDASDLVARLGSDEFALLVGSLNDVLHVETIARRLLASLAKPVSLGSRSIFVSASLGIAIASAAYERGEDVMRDADTAMHYAKGGGGSRFAIYDSRMHARAEKRLQLTTDLRLGLENGEFDVLYQPIVNIVDGSLAGCEALLRWNHPTEGIMSPTEFMSIAEQTGLAVPIGRFVMRTACKRLARWQRAANRRALFPVNINVSAAELLDPDFERTLLSVTHEAGLEGRDIVLEITESVVLDSGSRSHALLDRLRGHGFGLCIDDFGTGYSSLRYLQQFKVDTIKIDRSFVSGQDGDIASEPIVRTLMTLAEAFDVRIVAEGIETERQRDILRNAGCRYGQGYYYARAMGPDELCAMYPSAFGYTARHASA